MAAYCVVNIKNDNMISGTLFVLTHFIRVDCTNN